MNVTLCVLFNSCIPDLDKHTVNRYLDKFWFLPYSWRVSVQTTAFCVLCSCLHQAATCTVSQINECLLFLVPLFRVPFLLLNVFLLCFYRRTCVVPPHDLWSLTCHSKCKKLYALYAVLEC